MCSIEDKRRLFSKRRPPCSFSVWLKSTWIWVLKLHSSFHYKEVVCCSSWFWNWINEKKGKIFFFGPFKYFWTCISLGRYRIYILTFSISHWYIVFFTRLIWQYEWCTYQYQMTLNYMEGILITRFLSNTTSVQLCNNYNRYQSSYENWSDSQRLIIIKSFWKSLFPCLYYWYEIFFVCIWTSFINMFLEVLSVSVTLLCY